MTTSAFMLTAPNGSLVLDVRRDGTVVLGNGVTLDAAARRFWEAVSLVMRTVEDGIATGTIDVDLPQ
mgnify:CR=1 FL=1